MIKIFANLSKTKINQKTILTLFSEGNFKRQAYGR